MNETFDIHRLDNGLTLLAQPMPGVESASMTMLLPGGSARDGDETAGAAATATEWIFRGAGERDSHELSDALDALGVRRSESVSSEHLQLSCGLLGRNLHEALEIYADIVLRPQLGTESFGPCRRLIEQDLASLEDEPAGKVHMLLKERFLPWPLGRCKYGTAETLAALTPEAVREHLARGCFPAGTILAAAGKLDPAKLREAVERLFGDWQVSETPQPDLGSAAGGVLHENKSSAQTHIALAHRAARMDEPLYYAGRVAQMVLSGGMSGRLFTEVREKRGLVYSVACRYQALKGFAGMFTYAGTRPEVAQQTLEVTVGELRRLAEGLEDGELQRARAQLKSMLVMQGESTGARAGAIASDWHHLGRLRSLEEMSEAIDAVTAEHVLEYLRTYPAREFTVAIIGPEALDVSAVREG